MKVHPLFPAVDKVPDPRELRAMHPSKFLPLVGLTTLTLLCVLCVIPSNASPEHGVFLGLDTGIQFLNADSPAGARIKESDKSGVPLQFKLVYSRFWEKWVGDAGLGWFYSSLSGNNQTRVSTNALFVELSPRYKFGEHFQLGPVTHILIGSDVSFSEGKSDLALAPLLGVRAQYEGIFKNEWIWRAGFQALTDVTISNRQIYLAQADLQIGIPLGQPSNRTHERVPEPTAPLRTSVPFATPEPTFFPTAVAIPPNPKVEKIGKDQIKIRLPESLLRFDPGQSSLSLQATTVVQELGQYLADHSNHWTKIRIEGHSDQKGLRENNLELSLARAQTIRDELLGSGIQIRRITVEGKGPDFPLEISDSPHALAANRRVEIYLDGVQAPDKMAKELKRVTDRAMR